jgi:lipopolysaccharide cholinephosphotransferase
MNIDIRELQLKQLDILRDFKIFCEREDIIFYLAYGSCLGAVRHEGFIPWDDDIDVLMSYSDFKKLHENKDQLPTGLFFQTQETDSEYGLPIARLRRDKTTLIEEEDILRDIHHGIYIDIYPLYNCPDNICGHFLIKLQALLYRLYLYNEGSKKKSGIVNVLSSTIVNVTPDLLKKYYLKYFRNKLKNIPETGFLTTLYGNDFSVKYKKENFSAPVMAIFEGESYPTPTNSHSHLQIMYGDYMQLPPEELRTPHHDFVFIDLEEDYKIYKGHKYLNGMSL